MKNRKRQEKEGIKPGRKDEEERWVKYKQKRKAMIVLEGQRGKKMKGKNITCSEMNLVLNHLTSCPDPEYNFQRLIFNHSFLGKETELPKELEVSLTGV